MKGNNTIMLCEAAMIEVAQKWIDDKSYKLGVIVTGVKQTTEGLSQIFHIMLKEAPPEPAE